MRDFAERFVKLGRRIEATRIGAAIKEGEKYDCPKVAPVDATEVTSRMEHIKPELIPIAKFILEYAYWDLHKDEWNHPVIVAPVFRMLDALTLDGKSYCCQGTTSKQWKEK